MRRCTAITSVAVLASLAACGQNVGTVTEAAPVTLPTEADVEFGRLRDNANDPVIERQAPNGDSIGRH